MTSSTSQRRERTCTSSPTGLDIFGEIHVLVNAAAAPNSLRLARIRSTRTSTLICASPDTLNRQSAT
jgi:hypothetical protein